MVVSDISAPTFMMCDMKIYMASCSNNYIVCCEVEIEIRQQFGLLQFGDKRYCLAYIVNAKPIFMDILVSDKAHNPFTSEGSTVIVQVHKAFFE